MSERPIRTRREAASVLTARQREVMDLLARGYTNAQVADALGISLDTAKFHVSEILSRLEAPSREDAVEIWQGRESTLRRLVGGLTGVRLAIAGGAAVVGVLLILAGLLFAGPDDNPDAPSSASAGIFVALIQPPPSSEHVRAGWEAPIRVIDVVSGTEHAFGPAAQYVHLAWSPDGTRLAAIALDRPADDDVPTDIHLRSWDPAGQLLEDVVLPPDRPLTHLAWSPDSTRLALVGDGIAVLDRDMREVGWFPAPPRIGGGGGPAPAGDLWSADSQYVASTANGLILVADRDGEGTAHEFPEGLTAGFRGWEGDRLNVVVITPQETSRILGTLSGDAITWGQKEPLPDEYAFPAEPTLTALATQVPGRSVFAGRYHSADGSATAFLVGEPATPGTAPSDPLAPRVVSLVVGYEGDQAIVDLGPVQSREFAMSLVTVPGWDGGLPASLSVATPLSAFPAPVLPTSGPPLPPQTEVPVTPRPYPTPTGDFVASQIPDAPVFPGGAEVDGFTRPNVSRPDVLESVQVFETSASEVTLFSFFEDALADAGFQVRGKGGGPNGSTLSADRGKDTVEISTAYIPRPDDPAAGDYPPYGYLGNARWDLEVRPGVRYYFVVTLRAP